MSSIRFVSKNTQKIAEVEAILKPTGIDVVSIRLTKDNRIEELQTADLEKLVRDKTVKTYAKIGRPLLVEHTGLYLNDYGDLPGGLTQLFWDQLGAEKFALSFGQKPNNQATSKTMFGYTDGRIVKVFSGEVKGSISAEPLGDQVFGWDCVFIPQGEEKTFAQLGEKKQLYSMRSQALQQVVKHLKNPANRNLPTSYDATLKTLKAQIDAKQVVLFVGAGVSMNLGLPSFQTLMRRFAERLEFDPELFLQLGDYLSLAEFFALRQDGLTNLPACLVENNQMPHGKPGDSEIYQAILELNFPIIYTTNYDTFLEQAHEQQGKRYTKISRVNDLANIQSDVTQIIKFHGDFEHPAGLVLTESSYFERLQFNSPLDIRLRSDVMGKSVFFIGYSLSDINIRYLLHQLNKLWASDDPQASKPPSFIFLTRPNAIQEAILTNRKILPIVAKDDDPQKALLDFLRKLSS